MAYDIFLRLDGITGESQVANYTGQIQVDSCSFGASDLITTSLQGASAGKVTLSPIVVTKKVDSTSPALFVLVAQGKGIATGTISFLQAAGDGTVSAFLTIDLGPVVLTQIATSASNTAMVETLTLACGSLKYTVTSKGPTGVLKPPVTGGWDAGKNKLL